MRLLTQTCKFLLPLVASSLCFAAQPDRIVGPIDSSRMVLLAHSVNLKAQPQYDQGRAEASLPFGSVALSIAPSPSQQAALDLLLSQQQDPKSPNYHKWLTPEQYADHFGLSQNDVNKITGWLQAEGLTIERVARGRNAVVFSGTASQLENTFKTEIHRYDINGEKHIANSTQLSIPAALSGVVTSVRGLTDFRPKPMYVRPSGGPKGPHPTYTTTIQGQTEYFLAPGDIATLYDLNPLYSSGIDGTGEKIAIIGQTDVYYADINDFRTGFGYSPIPTGSGGCTLTSAGVITSPCDTANFEYVLVGEDQPVSLGDVVESDLDLEWSGAVAYNAQIVFVTSPINSTGTTGGVINALEYAIDNVVAPVITMSYGLCELETTAQGGLLETELEQGVGEGITIMNSAGDSGSFACDTNPPGTTSTSTPPLPYDPAIGGIGVNYPASSPEVTGVGGTAIPLSEFSSTYWSATNGSNGESVNTNVIGTEILWNDDVAFAQGCQEGLFSATFCETGGPPAVNNWVDITSAQAAQEDIWISEGGGGVSNCVTMNSGGICQAGFPQPSWQSSVTIPGLGSPQSTYRFVPDVSLLASPNFPGYIFCTPVEELSSTPPYDTETTSSCASGIATAADGTVVDGNFVIDPSIIGGTSASSPIFAATVALIEEYLGGSSLSNINPSLYTLAQTPANGAFHLVTSGDSDVYCQAGDPTGQPSDVICPSAGVFGFSASNDASPTSYNLAAGLGSVDAHALAVAWAASLAPDYQLTAGTLNPSPVSAGASTSTTITISPITGSTGTVVNFSTSSCTGLPTGATCSFNPSSVTFNGTSNATTTLTIATVPNMAIPSGAQTITITPQASPKTTTTVSLTVTPTTESFTLASTNGATFPVIAGGTASVQIVVSSTSSPSFIVGTGTGATTAVPLTYSCSGSPNLASAEIACTVNNNQPTNLLAVTAVLTTTGPTTQIRRPFGSGRLVYAFLLPGLFGVVFAVGSRKRGIRLLSMIVVFTCCTIGLGSCGGGGNSGGSGGSNPGTPAGTYTITISATTGGASPLTNSTQITLNVSQ